MASSGPVDGGVPGLQRKFPAGSGKGERVIQLRGVVRAGVERGAVVLLDSDGALLAQLMGGDPAVIADGLRVIVTGNFVAGLLTTAQQGRPFQVRDAVADPA